MPIVLLTKSGMRNHTTVHHLREKLPRERAVNSFVKDLKISYEFPELGFEWDNDNPLYNINHRTPSGLIGDYGNDLAKIYEDFGLYGLALYAGCKVKKIMPNLPKKTDLGVNETGYLPNHLIEASYNEYLLKNEHGELLDYEARFGKFGRCYMERCNRYIHVYINGNDSLTYNAMRRNKHSKIANAMEQLAGIMERVVKS